MSKLGTGCFQNYRPLDPGHGFLDQGWEGLRPFLPLQPWWGRPAPAPPLCACGGPGGAAPGRGELRGPFAEAEREAASIGAA